MPSPQEALAMLGALRQTSALPQIMQMAQLEQELLEAEHPLLERFRDEAGIMLN